MGDCNTLTLLSVCTPLSIELQTLSDLLQDSSPTKRTGRTEVCTDLSVADVVTQLLDEVAKFRGYPATVRTDCGPEFTARADAAQVNITRETIN
jgi:hydrogenase maturation factor HypF (carbamoyltransferase family)